MTVRCGNCKSEHDNAVQVKICYTKGSEALVDHILSQPKPDREELEAEQRHHVTMPSVQTKLVGMPAAKRTPVPTHLRREDKPGGLPFTEVGVSNIKAKEEVLEGRYAVMLDGKQKTIRFHTPKIGKFKGVQLIDYLYGPDNTMDGDWVRFANWSGDGYRVWGKYINNIELVNAVKHMTGASVDELMDCGEAYARASSNCWRCGRDLTVEESIVRGMGPICADKVGA